jgi:hypothetical protein
LFAVREAIVSDNTGTHPAICDPNAETVRMRVLDRLPRSFPADMDDDTGCNPYESEGHAFAPPDGPPRRTLDDMRRLSEAIKQGTQRKRES